MQLQAPAIAEFRPAGLDTAKVATWLRGIGVRQVRIACGLVMFSYIFSHFFNHALGNISYPTMEAWLYLHIWWWRIPIVNATLYTAAVIHFSAARSSSATSAFAGTPYSRRSATRSMSPRGCRT